MFLHLLTAETLPLFNRSYRKFLLNFDEKIRPFIRAKNYFSISLSGFSLRVFYGNSN